VTCRYPEPYLSNERPSILFLNVKTIENESAISVRQAQVLKEAKYEFSQVK
jgi:hypothetical protein